MIKKLFNLLEKNFHFLILLFLFSSLTNFFYNLYPLLIRNYEERMITAYNTCGEISYGYINKIYKYYINNNKILIINFEIGRAHV